MVIVASTLIAKPGKREQVIQLAGDALAATRREEGCISYKLFASTEDDVTLFFFEEWRDIEALNRHSQSAHLASFKQARSDLVEGPSKVRIFEANERKR